VELRIRLPARPQKEIRRGKEHLIERERRAQNGDLEHEAEFSVRSPSVTDDGASIRTK
jgi:hypothetical protein